MTSRIQRLGMVSKNWSVVSIYLWYCFFTVPPSSPVGPLQATNVDATELTLSWQAPEFNGESPITSYFLHYFTMKPERSEWEFLAQIPANQTMYHVKGLKEKTEYCFSIKAVNEWGPSEPLEMKKPVETKILKGKRSKCNKGLYT